jgi:hypothetical protein
VGIMKKLVFFLLRFQEVFPEAYFNVIVSSKIRRKEINRMDPNSIAVVREEIMDKK